MSKLRVGVLRGGPSSEYEVSLKTGAAILNNLPEHYSGHDIFISRDGVWHKDGLTRTPDRALKHIDVVFNGLHGEYGEDGKVQKLLDALGVPYTGSGAFASAVGMNKALSKLAFEKHDIKTPFYTTIKNTDPLKEKIEYTFKNFIMPVVVKPATTGSSVGVTIVRNINNLEQAIQKALVFSSTALIEEFIQGKESTCGVVDHFRGEKVYSLLPVEIIQPEESDFFDYDAKYSGKSQEICPGRFTRAEMDEIQRLAKLVHQSLGLRHYSRTDMMVSQTRGVYVLEVNTLPGLTAQSLLPLSFEAVGTSFKDMLHHVIQLALRR